MSDPSVKVLDAFFSQASAGERVDLLVVPKTSQAIQSRLARENSNGRVDIISDNRTLVERCETIESELKYTRHRQIFSEFLNNLFSFEYIPDGVAGAFRWSLINWMGASRANYDPTYLICRDEVSGATLSRFLSAFTRIPPRTRPKIVFDAQGEPSNARDLLRTTRDSARLFSPRGGSISDFEIGGAGATSSERFIDLYAARALSICAESELVEPNPHGSIQDHRRYIIQMHQRIQAKKGCDRKFDASNDVVKLQSFLKKRIALSKAGEERWFAEALVFVLLDRAYVLEDNDSTVDDALTLAKILEDDEIEALASRFINFSAGVTPFASHQLGVSAELLMKSGRLVESLYSRANQVITDLHRVEGRLDEERSKEMVEFALGWTPYCDRLSSVLNAAGVTALLANKISDACDYFRQAAQANGTRLHQLSAEVNLLIAQHAAGGADDDSIEQIFAAIENAKISRKLDYHHTYLYGNLLALARKRGLKSRISRHLKSAKFMDYDDDVIDKGEIFSYLATKFNVISDGRKFRGHRGKFVDRHGLLPLCPFIWS